MDSLTGDDISVHRLRVFVTVVDQGGYSAAAEELGLAQPSVSYHVHALERTLGTELVTYRNRSIHLTPEGEEAYRTARTIINEGARLGDTIERMQGGLKGRLAVGASIAFEHPFFFDLVVGPYSRAHPEVELSLRFAHSIDLVDEVGTGSIDLAYVNDWQIPPELDFEPLHRSELVFLVAAGHPLAGRGTVSADDINEAGLIASPIEASEVFSYHEMLRSAGIRNPRIAIEVDGIQARKLATQSGLGVLATFAPDYAGEHAMDPLRTLRLTVKSPTIEFGMVTRRQQPWTPMMEDLGALLRSVAAS
jgi:DNA-binding transcriptional LysR family regulator